jgi:hypothetical protein
MSPLCWPKEVSFVKRVSLVAALGALCYLVIFPVAAATAAPAASSGAATYQGTPGSAARLTQAASVSSFPAVKSAFKNLGPQTLAPVRTPNGSDPAAASTAAKTPSMSANASVSGTVSPAASAASGSKHSNARVVQAFNGLSNLDSDNLNGFPDTPPDQGLCVGRDTTLPGSPTAVLEPINSASRETTRSGTLLRPDVSLATLFQDPFAEGDVRCLYDPSTQSFYFTEIGFPVATGPASDDNNTTADVVVMNKRGVAAYQFDTSLGGPAAGDCFGDQPKTGFDNNALVISTDEYCGPTESNYEGAIALVISKSQLVHENSTVNDSVLGPVALQGNPVVGLDPAINTGSGTGYFVNSVPFLANGNNNPVGDTLGVWTLRNSASVTTGHGTPVLTGRAIPSEPYAFPVPATSTGDGSTTTVDGLVITSETALNPDDSRMSGPVEVTRGRGGVQLTTALDAAVTVKGDTTDAGAWFQVSPNAKRVVSQGYVIAKGANLLYPAIQPSRSGPGEMVFTITSATINPSAAFTAVGSGRITTVADGTGPHLSFSDAPPFNEPRWGDYSFVAPDPSGNGVWLATEYIPPTANQDPFDNWGTYVFEVTGR